MDTANNTKFFRQIVKGIQAVIDPIQIILFGSQARGDATPDSDFDLLIIAPSKQSRWQRTLPVYQALAGLGVSKDIVWWTPEEIAQWQNVKSHFITTILREGKVLYENPAGSRTGAFDKGVFHLSCRAGFPACQNGQTKSPPYIFNSFETHPFDKSK